MVVDEDRELGMVKGTIYSGYLVQYGVINFAVVITLWGAEQVVQKLTTWWLSKWTDDIAQA